MVGKLIKRQMIAENTVELTFQLDKEADFLAGQDMLFTIPDMPYTDSKGNNRSFSIASSPSDKTHITIATRVSDSTFKQALMKMEMGDELFVSDIYGEMVLPEKTDQHLVFIAGGIGITPFMSMLRYIKERGLEYNITMLYSNKTEKSTAYLEELQDYHRELENFRLLLIMTNDDNWIGESRRIGQEFIREKIEDYENVKFFFVGPPAMVSGIQASLDNLKIKKENMVGVEFSGY
ncbi:MAG: FAD-dependent oxidoreductase [bacterium]